MVEIVKKVSSTESALQCIATHISVHFSPSDSGLLVEILYNHIWLSFALRPSKVVSGWVLTCDSAHSWWFHSAAPLGSQVISTMV